MRKDIDSSLASPTLVPDQRARVPVATVSVLFLTVFLGAGCRGRQPPVENVSGSPTQGTVSGAAVDPDASVVPPVEAGPPRQVGSRFLFTLEAADARTVALSGTFNGWLPSGVGMTRSDDVWWVLVELPRGRQRYKFVIDGISWVVDPENPRRGDDGAGGQASLIDVR